MYPAPFQYHAPATVAEALALLDKLGDDAKVIAGSMSLVPLMKFRLATPGYLVDLRKVPGMSGVSQVGDSLQIGALTTHRQMETDALVRAKLPMMSDAAAQIGDAQVRNMGTMGGSLAHADPSADWPAVTTALGATVHLVSKKGERAVPIEAFILGPLTTALEPGELIHKISVPLHGKHAGSAYEKLPHPASRFAVVGVAAVVVLDKGGVVTSARVAITGLGPKAARAAAVESALQGKQAGAAELRAASAHTTHGLELQDDLLGTAAWRGHMAAVYAERALVRAVERARKNS